MANIAPFYYGLLSVGGICIILGVIIIGLVLKFVRRNRTKHIITGAFFVLAGIGIIWLILLTPSPSMVQNQTTEMLIVNPEPLLALVIFEEHHKDKPIAQVDDKGLLYNWTSVLASCQPFSPNHPRYDKSYHIVAKLSTGKDFLYEVAFDTKQPNTTDLTLLQADQSRTGYYDLGTYRCNGLFEFISALVSGN